MTSKGKTSTSMKPQRPQSAQRRSTRLRSGNGTEEDSGTGFELGAKLADQAGHNSPRRRKLVQDGEEGRKGVKKMIRELDKLEQELQTVTKRQRLAVENSHLNVSQAYLVEPYAVVKQNTSDCLHLTPTPGTSPIDASPEKPDVDAEMGDADVVEVPAGGPDRPRPVNSDYLPLPWKGRLGYVNHPPEPVG
jgi:hypothetical protein